MEVVIVSKTRMNNKSCVGGVNPTNKKNIRILTMTEENQSQDTKLEIGQVWDILYKPRAICKPPHIEDVLVSGKEYIRSINSMKDFINLNAVVHRGYLIYTFNGLLQYTPKGATYISQIAGVPLSSVCFWESPHQLIFSGPQESKYEFSEQGRSRRIRFVGYQNPPSIIKPGTLLRLSLARWWKPKDGPTCLEERCYLQISGYFL